MKYRLVLCGVGTNENWILENPEDAQHVSSKLRAAVQENRAIIIKVHRTAKSTETLELNVNPSMISFWYVEEVKPQRSQTVSV